MLNIYDGFYFPGLSLTDMEILLKFILPEICLKILNLLFNRKTITLGPHKELSILALLTFPTSFIPELIVVWALPHCFI